jgi:hypothetical protein
MWSFAFGKPTAVACFRTSSTSNVGGDKDSENRQRQAVTSYAKAVKLDLVAEFYDAAVSGADPVDQRAGFVQLLEHCAAHGVEVVLVENASRFARDLIVQRNELPSALPLPKTDVTLASIGTDPTKADVKNYVRAVVQITGSAIRLPGAALHS